MARSSEKIGTTSRALGGRPVARTFALVLAGLSVVVLAIILIRGRDWSAGEHRTNYREISLVGRSIESWPISIEAMARSNLLPDRLDAPPDALMRDRHGWSAAARFDSTDFGQMVIHYRLSKEPSRPGVGRLCSEAPPRDVWIDSKSSALRMQGKLPLDELWHADQAIGGASSAAEPAGIDQINAVLSAVIPPQLKQDFGAADRAAACPAIDFEAKIPLAQVVNLEANAPAYAAMLLMNSEGAVIASLGGTPLPVTDLKDVVPDTAFYRAVVRQLLAATSPSAAKDSTKALESSERLARQEALLAQRSARPLSVIVAGEEFIAYFRPIRFRNGWQSPDCSPQNGGGASPEAPAARGGSPDLLAAPETNCLLLGLVRERQQMARLFSLSPDLLTFLVMLLALVIVAVPVSKLRFLGPAGYLSPIETWAAVFSLVAAFALSTLVVLLFAAGLRSRAVANHMLEQTSREIETQFHQELKAILARPIWAPGAEPLRTQPKTPKIFSASPIVHVGLTCYRADGTATNTAQAHIPRHDREFWQLPLEPPSGAKRSNERHPADASQFMVWPARELIGLFGELGRAFPGYSLLANRCHSGGRPDISGRAYFAAVLAGERHGILAISPRNVEAPTRQAIDRAGSRQDGPGQACSLLPELAIANHYVIDAVRSQTDGMPKTVIVTPFALGAAGELPLCPPAKDKVTGATALPAKPDDGTNSTRTKAPGPRTGVVLQTAVMRSLLMPVLPRGHRFIIVDASDRQLPYLFGSAAHRIGIDALGDELGSGRAKTAIARAMLRAATADASGAGQPIGVASEARQMAAASGTPAAHSPDSEHFTAVFEGVKQKFVARGMRGTPWVLLVHSRTDELDAPLAEAAVLAAGIWFGLAVLVSVGLIIAALRWKRSLWLWLWPRPGLGAAARRAGNAVLVLVAFGVFAFFATANSFDPPALLGLAMFVIPIVAVAAARMILAQAEVPHPPRYAPDMTDALRTADERGFARLLLALLLALGTVPMLGLWRDIRWEQFTWASAADTFHLEQAWAANRKAVESQVRRNFGMTDASMAMLLHAAEVTTPPAKLMWAGVHGLAGDEHGLVGGEDVKVEHSDRPTMTAIIRRAAGLGRPTAVRTCSPASAEPDDVFCVDAAGQVGLTHQPQDDGAEVASWLRRIWWPGAIGGLLGGIALAGALRSTLSGSQRALFGFGVPLEAVQYPGIARRNGTPLISDRAVILNGPLPLLIDLLGNTDPLDIGNYDSDKPLDFNALLREPLERLDAGGTVVVTGLDVALKDARARYAALQILERLADRVERQARTAAADTGKLVVMTDLSPLDRILQAYEREQQMGENSGRASGEISRPEQLRWSRLFEDFTTYTLPVRAKYIWNHQRKLAAKRRIMAHKPECVEGVLQLMKEVRYLPEAVIHSLIDPEDVPKRQHWFGVVGDNYPLREIDYNRIYTQPVWRWANKVCPATREAATDFLRGVLIEHYQHLWAASSNAERVILDNLARGRVINIDAALAIRSLIRRGMVVLDPAPRLVNESFAAFVRQAEKPEAINLWRSEQPKGGWDKVSRPLAFILPLAILLLSGTALMSGESMATVLPVILGAGPALLSTLGGMRRAESS